MADDTTPGGGGAPDGDAADGGQAEQVEQAEQAQQADMTLYDLRVTVESIEGRSVCGLRVGDYFELRNSNELRLPEGRHFCIYALQSVLPLLPAKQRQLPAGDWLETDSLVCCPDPEERVVMRIERIGVTHLRAADLT